MMLLVLQTDKILISFANLCRRACNSFKSMLLFMRNEEKVWSFKH